VTEASFFIPAAIMIYGTESVLRNPLVIRTRLFVPFSTLN